MTERLGGELRQTKIGKLHLLAEGGLKTVCGIKVSASHWSDPADEIWLGRDKCRRCLAALERGDLGVSIVIGSV